MAHSITLQTSDPTITDNDILGKISFAAPNETGADALLVSASIFARAEAAFDADENATELVFVTSASESSSPGTTNGDMILSSAGNLILSGTITCATSLTIGSAAMSEADLEFLDGITAGTAAASKAVVLNGSKNIATIGTVGCGAITSTGNSGFAQVTTSGRVIVDDATDATSTTDGSLQTDGGLSVAKDCILGNDVKLLTDSSVLSLGIGSDATFTHDGTTGLTIAANPITLDSGAAINIEPASGSVILLDGTISIDAGVVTGATSITSTAFVGNITGNVTGNTSGTALTVTQAAQTAITSVGTLTALQVDNININGNAITSTAGTDLTITPLDGQQIVLDGTIVIDAGVVTGATSITSTAFVGDITGDVTGNASGTALTVTQAAQSAITSVGTLTTLSVDDIIINASTIDFNGSTGDNKLDLADNIANGLDIVTGGSDSYMKFNTQTAATEVTYTKEAIEISKPLKCTKAIHSSISKTNAVATGQTLKGGGSGNVVTLDLASAGFFRVQLDNNVDEIWFKNQAEGQKIIIRFEQDGTGSRTVDFSDSFYATDGTLVSVQWSADTPPTLTTTAGKSDIIGLLNFGIPSGNVHWYNAIVIGQNFD